MSAKYAVLFKVFYVDDFVRRQLERVIRRVDGGHVYVVCDETHGPLAIEHDRVIRINESDLLALGVVAGCGSQSVFWYDADYILYYCSTVLPGYEYFITMEYDAIANCELDAFVDWANASRADFVGRPIREDVSKWSWSCTCVGVYEPIEIVRPFLNCVALYSAAASAYLLERRRSHSMQFRTGKITNWPISEAFIGTELAQGGFNVVDIQGFGAVPNLTWWPPLHEKELPTVDGESFVHPVLTGPRFIQSMLRYEPATDIFRPETLLSRKLAFEMPSDYLPLLLPKLTSEHKPDQVSKYLPPYELLRGGLDDPKSVSRIGTGHDNWLRAVCGLFLEDVYVDELWYASHYDDISAAMRAGSIVSCRDHFLRSGYFEGRLPAEPMFDEAWYVSHYIDVAKAIETGAVGNARTHFIEVGRREGRAGVPDHLTDADKWIAFTRKSGWVPSR
jgi:hypothetical protein